MEYCTEPSIVWHANKDTSVSESEGKVWIICVFLDASDGSDGWSFTSHSNCDGIQVSVEYPIARLVMAKRNMRSNGYAGAVAPPAFDDCPP